MKNSGGKGGRDLHAINHYFSSLLYALICYGAYGKDAEKSLQLLQFFISKKTEKRIIINKSY